MKLAHKRGFTLIEIILVVVILGILAAVALPKLTGANEMSLSSEGRHLLVMLLGAQSRYKLENNSYAVDAGGNIAALDVDITPKYFTIASIGADDPDSVARITRAGGPVYDLGITGTGTIWCVGAGCPAVRCSGRGAGPASIAGSLKCN